MTMNAKTSVPVILYTTEQIFCAHFMVKLFQRWLAREEQKEDACAEGVDIPEDATESARSMTAGDTTNEKRDGVSG